MLSEGPLMLGPRCSRLQTDVVPCYCLPRLLGSSSEHDQALAPLALLLLPLTQTYSWAPAVLVDELDARRFQCVANG